MAQRGTEGRDDRESRQLELAREFFRSNSLGKRLPAGLSTTDCRLLFQELKSHYSLHVAQGNEAESRLMLKALKAASDSIVSLSHECKKLFVADYERRGMGGRALEQMAKFYEELREKDGPSAQIAEIAMECGILQDRHGNKEVALRLFQEAIGRYEVLDERYNLCAAWFNYASVLYDLERSEESFAACKLGFELGGGEFGDLSAHLSLQRANCYERLVRIDEACLEYENAALAYARLGNYRQQTNILFRVGWLKYRQNQKREGQFFLTKALKLAKALDYSAGLARYNLHKAQSIWRLGDTAAARHFIQQCLSFSTWARLERLEKLGRGLLYRIAGCNRRSLTFYLKARISNATPLALKGASTGIYAHRGSDGVATRLWRDSPRSAGQDITFLVRLLAELGRQAKQPELILQSRAVRVWQQSMREGRRLL